MDRRKFLQMLGVGGAALVSTAAAASPVPLFSGRESNLWTPEHASLTRSHLVLTAPPRMTWSPAPTPAGASPSVIRLTRRRWPTCGHSELLHMDEDTNVPSVKILVPRGIDPHEAFYKASMKMRSGFAAQSRRRLEEISEWRRPQSTLVTLVDTEIFAGALFTPGFHEPEDPERGFVLQISYTPHVIDSGDELGLNGWEIYSENGEYPLEIPTTIDMDRLLHVDRQIVTGNTTPRRLGGRLILEA